MSLLDNQINIRDQRKQKENVYIYISPNVHFCWIEFYRKTGHQNGQVHRHVV